MYIEVIQRAAIKNVLDTQEKPANSVHGRRRVAETGRLEKQTERSSPHSDSGCRSGAAYPITRPSHCAKG